MKQIVHFCCAVVVSSVLEVRGSTCSSSPWKQVDTWLCCSEETPSCFGNPWILGWIDRSHWTNGRFQLNHCLLMFVVCCGFKLMFTVVYPWFSSLGGHAGVEFHQYLCFLPPLDDFEPTSKCGKTTSTMEQANPWHPPKIEPHNDFFPLNSSHQNSPFTKSAKTDQQQRSKRMRPNGVLRHWAESHSCQSSDSHGAWVDSKVGTHLVVPNLVVHQATIPPANLGSSSQNGSKSCSPEQFVTPTLGCELPKVQFLGSLGDCSDYHISIRWVGFFNIVYVSTHLPCCLGFPWVWLKSQTKSTHSACIRCNYVTCINMYITLHHVISSMWYIPCHMSSVFICSIQTKL